MPLAPVHRDYAIKGVCDWQPLLGLSRPAVEESEKQKRSRQRKAQRALKWLREEHLPEAHNIPVAEVPTHPGLVWLGERFFSAEGAVNLTSSAAAEFLPAWQAARAAGRAYPFSDELREAAEAQVSFVWWLS